MANFDFEAPSFSLGLDSGLLDSELHISSVSQDRDPNSSNHFSVAPATLSDKDDDDDDFETLIVDDSEPEYMDSRPKLKRLRRGLTMDAASSLVSAKAREELRPMAVVDDEDRSTDEHHHTQYAAVFTGSKVLTNRPGKRKLNVSNARESVLTNCNDTVFPRLPVSPLRRFQVIDSDSDFDDPSVSGGGNNGAESYVGSSKPRKVIESIDLPTSEIQWEDFRSEKTSLNLDDSLPPAHRYFFHDDLRIQELVRSRLPNFSPLGNTSNRDLKQPGTSKIDYMGQFRCEISKQAARNIKDKKDSSSRKVSRKSETEEMSQGWVNPKLGVGIGITKRTAKRKVHAARQTAGHWLTGPDGKKVYVGKRGQELTGRVAYIQYKKESGVGFKKAKRKSATKKKK